MRWLRRSVEAEGGGLPRVLLIRYRKMPAKADWQPGVRVHTATARAPQERLPSNPLQAEDLSVQKDFEPILEG
jgi:hypothetical protein